ncbi:MAG: hypothetical protein P1P89_15855 [Desulfobacterales bacterium]|nr:hypothetical protein [Desulfobacterales bacterium]
MHNENLNAGQLKKDDGLHEYVHGGGERLLDPNARSGIYINDTLPMSAIVFKRKNCPEEYCFDSPVVVRNIDGVEFVRERPKPVQPTR